MSGFRISKAAYQDDTLVEVAKACSNTTVGPNKYQLFCATVDDLDGSCVKLPSYLTSAGELDCYEVTSQRYLENLFASTGMACAVNCYYPTTINLPTFQVPPGSSVYPTRTYEYPSTTISSTRPILPPTQDAVPTFLVPDNNGAGVEGGASMTGPNFLFMAVFAVMLLCVRRAV